MRFLDTVFIAFIRVIRHDLAQIENWNFNVETLSGVFPVMIYAIQFGVRLSEKPGTDIKNEKCRFNFIKKFGINYT